MASDFLIYGSTGFVGDVITRLAVQQGLTPIIAGRNAEKVRAQATELGVEYRVLGLDDSTALNEALGKVPVVLHCAGPYIHTSKPIVDGCLRNGTHYLDLTGEIQVYQALAAREAEAQAKRVMLLPGVGFDVVPTDCLALHLKQRLPSATHLALAFCSQGPARLPSGTINTMLTLLPQQSGVTVRRNGQLEFASPGKTRMIDFGAGPVRATRWTWGDVFMAYYSTGIPNIEEYTVLSRKMVQQMNALSNLRWLFRWTAVRNFVRSKIPAGSTAEERAKTRTLVWGEVQDDQGGKAVSRLSGPDAGVTWTAMAALAAVQKVLNDHAPPGFQTPARAYGAGFVLEGRGITREDLN